MSYTYMDYQQIAHGVQSDIVYAHQGAVITGMVVDQETNSVIVIYTDSVAWCVNTGSLPLSMDRFGLRYQWSDEPRYFGRDAYAAHQAFAEEVESALGLGAKPSNLHHDDPPN